MKKIALFFILGGVLLTACKSEKKEDIKEEQITFVSFGDKITAENAMSQEDMAAKFKAMTFGDTLDVKFSTTVKEVCQQKGCWIKVPLVDQQESFVKFKDYGFFMPFNAAGSDVILNGKAFKSEVSVKELQHYAKDAGKSDEEIAAIKTPKVTYSFIADGVLLESMPNE